MNFTIDTGVILAFALKEADKNPEFLEKLFLSIKEGDNFGFISAITVSEIFDVFSRLGEAKKAVELVIFLKESGIKITEVNETAAKNAGLFKAKYSETKKGFSYADALILETAFENKSDMALTFDPEFDGITEIKIAKPSSHLFTL